ncbi:MDR family MFS transporter [Devosia sp.]|uniref:MDR family MFS transporter n=1 Tax=Devosia sp. TaxID=1871048 RepID=UPI0032667FFA
MTDQTTTFDAAPASAPITEDMAARNKLVIGLLLISAFVVILNETIMGVALPHLMKDLNIPASSAQWLTTAFMLTMAVVIPITGFLLQKLNTRPVFILAMSLFSAGTLISALSPGFAMLVIGRIVQASGTAIMMPLLMTTVMHLVPPESRGKTMGNISIVISVAPAIGPTISGLILSVLDWRWMFILVLPIALGALALGASRIRNVTTPKDAPIDVLSILLSIIGFGGFVYGVSGIGNVNPEPGTLPAWIPLVIGAATIVIFVFRQLGLQKQDRALLDLRTLTSTTFTLAVVMMSILMMSMFGAFILIPIYLQNVLHFDVLHTGLLLLPGGLIMGLCAPTVGKYYDKYGPRPLVIPGSVILAVALWTLTLVTPDTSFWLVLVVHLLMSVGLALMFTPLFTVSLGALPPNLYSHGSAMIGTTQQVAGAAGTALFVALFTLQSTQLGLGGADLVAATSGGLHIAFITGAVISLAAVVISLFITKPPESGMPGDMGHGH